MYKIYLKQRSPKDPAVHSLPYESIRATSVSFRDGYVHAKAADGHSYYVPYSNIVYIRDNED